MLLYERDVEVSVRSSKLSKHHPSHQLHPSLLSILLRVLFHLLAVPSYRRAVDMYSDSVQEERVGSQLGGDNDEDWCAPSVSQQNNDDDEEVLVEKEEEGGGIEQDEKASVFRADTDASGGGAGNDEGAKETMTAPVAPDVTSKKAASGYEDMANYEDESLALDDDCVGGADGGIVMARRYDVSITYGTQATIQLTVF